MATVHTEERGWKWGGSDKKEEYRECNRRENKVKKSVKCGRKERTGEVSDRETKIEEEGMPRETKKKKKMNKGGKEMY